MKLLHLRGNIFNFPVLASCQSPGGIAHGKMFGTDYRHGKTVRYKCDAEYILEGKNRLICNDGKWNYNPPQCKGNKVTFCERQQYLWAIDQAWR